MNEEMSRVISNIRDDMYTLGISQNMHDVYWKHDGDGHVLVYPHGTLTLPEDEELAVLILMVFHLGLSVGGNITSSNCAEGSPGRTRCADTHD